MVLKEQQKKLLDIASQRVAKAKASGADMSAFKTDIKNIDYATNNLGYSYTPPTPSIKPEAPEENVDAAAGEGSVAEEMVAEQDAGSDAALLAAENTTNSLERDKVRISEKRRQEAETGLAESKQKEEEAVLGLQETKFDPMVMEEKLRKDLDLQAKEEAFDAIQTEINEEKTRLKQEKMAIESKPILGSLIRGQKALAQRQSYAKMEALAMEADVIGGQLDRATNRLDKMMGWMKDSIETERENYKIVLGLAGRDVIDLTKEERRQVDKHMATLDKQIEGIEQHKDDVRNMQIQSPTAFAKAGINLATDDYDTIVAKFAVANEDVSYVENMRESYPDAGIQLTDNPQVAEQKMRNSTSFKSKFRFANGIDSAKNLSGRVMNYLVQDENGDWGVNADALEMLSSSEKALMYEAANRKADELNTTTGEGDINMDDITESLFGAIVKPEAPTKEESRTGYTIDGVKYKDLNSVMASLGKDVAQQVKDTQFDYIPPGVDESKEGLLEITLPDGTKTYIKKAETLD